MATNGFCREIPTKREGENVAIIVCFFLGLGTLLPWNSVLTIADYYYQLFPDYHPSRVLTLVYQPCAVGTMAILAYNVAKMDTRKRNLVGFSLAFLGTLVLLLLDLGTSGKGGLSNYIGVCVVVACYGIADAHCMGGMSGDLSLMHPELLQSYYAGLAGSGALTSVLRLMTKGVFDKSDNGLRKGFLLFLSIAAVLGFLCISTYTFIFPKLFIVKYYRSKAASEGSKTISTELTEVGVQTKRNYQGVGDNHLDRLSNKQLFFQNIDLALVIYLIYVLTLSIMPGFLFENTGIHKLGSWYAIVLVALYNVWDLIGRYVPVIKCIKLESRKGLLFACLSRFLLVPAFYFTAKYGDQGWMIMLVSLLGLTNGYLTVCVITIAPKGYKAPEQNALGNLLTLCLLGGLLSGACLGWFWMIGKQNF
ncbi:hypothetical protein Leryth_025385 [Lithospermum erythrorhizon]|nr:hypothetical protein Leryth_025385 [Lithospermum erythrorhizon]